MVNTFIELLLICSPLFYIPGLEARAVQESFFQLAGIAMLGVVWCERAKRTVSLRWAGAFVLFALANYLWYRARIGHTVLLNIFIGLWIARCVAEHADVDDLRRYARAIAIVIVLNAVVMLTQMFDHDLIYTPRFPENNPHADLVGIFNLRAFVGTYMAMTIPLVARFYPWLLPLVAWGLYASQSTAAVVGAFGALLTMLWCRSRRFAIGLAALCAIVSAVYVIWYDAPTGDFHLRLQVWDRAIKLWLHSPAILWGFGWSAWPRFKLATLKLNGEPNVWLEAHNEYVQLAFEGGLIALLLLGGWIRWAAARWWRWGTRNEAVALLGACLVGLALNCTLQFPFHLARHAMTAVILIGLYIGAVHEAEA